MVNKSPERPSRISESSASRHNGLNTPDPQTAPGSARNSEGWFRDPSPNGQRSEEHTSELQSPCNLVCRLLLEKKKKPPYPAARPLKTAHDGPHPEHRP